MNGARWRDAKRAGEFGNARPIQHRMDGWALPRPHFFWKTSLAMPTAVTALGHPE
jgi:hypothetical protein